MGKTQANTETSELDFHCQAADLAQALDRVRLGIAPRTAQMPILRAVRLEVTETDGAWFRTTNLEISVRLRIAVRCHSPGSVLLLFDRLDGIVEAMPSNGHDIRFRQKETNVGVAAGHAKYRLRTLPLEDFPKLRKFKEEPQQVDREKLLWALSQVQYAMGSSVQARHLMYCRVSGGQLAACDGFRVAVADVPIAEDLTVSIPRAGVVALSKFLGQTGNEVVEVRLGQGRGNKGFMLFGHSDDSLEIGTGDLQFPDYREYMAQLTEKDPMKWRVNRGALIEAIRQVSVCLVESGQSGITFQLAKEMSLLVARTVDGEVAQVPIAGDWSGEEPLKIVLSRSYVEDVLGVLSSEEVVFDFYGDNTTVRIDCGNSLHLLSPRRR